MVYCRGCDKYKNLIYELRNKNVGYGTIARLTGMNVKSIIYECKKQGLTGMRGIFNQKKPSKPKVVYLNECWHCGEQFITKRKGNRFCGDSCRDKYNRIKQKVGKVCTYCGKPIDIKRKGNTKYCSDECMTSWYRENPRHLKVCECCGNEFKTNDKTQKYCSRECCGKGIAPIVSEKVRATALKQNKQLFIKMFNTRYGATFEYISGYTGCDSRIKIKCKNCQSILERNARSLRRKNRTLTCLRCLRIKSRENDEYNIQVKQYEQAKAKDERRIKKELIIQERIKLQEIRLQEPKLCRQCGKVFYSLKRKVFCSDKCSNKYGNHQKELLRRTKLQENGKVDYSITLEKLMTRDKNRCHICGVKCNINDYVIDNNGYFIAGDDYPSIDHLNPVAKGGTHTWDNIKLAHRGCNNAKSDNDCFINSNGEVVLAI